MNPDMKPNNLKYLILGAGGLGFFLQRMLFDTGIDEKELLTSGHWALVSLLILSALVAAAAFFATRSLQTPQEVTVHPSISGCLGCLLGAAALFVRLPQPLLGPDKLYLLERYFSMAAQLMLCILAFCRLTGRKPHFLLHGTLCLYLAVRMVAQYRLWSSDPQLMDYAFFLLAHVALALSAYQLAAWDAGFGNLKKLWFWGLIALYLCICPICSRENRISLLLLGIWLFTSLPLPPKTIPDDSFQEVIS